LRLVVCPLRQLQSSLSQSLGHSHTILSSCYVQLSLFYCKASTISLSTINTFIHEQRNELDFAGDTHLWYLYLPIIWFFINPFKALAKPLFGIATTKTIVDNSAHVPTFYAPITTSSVNGPLILVYFVLPVVAVLFGGLHCIGWNFDFPSHTEQLLWRIASLAITSIPAAPLVVGLIVVPIISLHNSLERRYDSDTVPSAPLPETAEVLAAMLVTVGGFLVGAGIIAYMLARLLLLTQAVVLLRKQPESAFYAINWADFLPHI